MVLIPVRKHAFAIPTSVSSPTLSGTGAILLDLPRPCICVLESTGLNMVG
jgi:hypothetical protein